MYTNGNSGRDDRDTSAENLRGGEKWRAIRKRAWWHTGNWFSKGEARAGVTDIQYIRLMILDPFKTMETSLLAPHEIIRAQTDFTAFLWTYIIIIRQYNQNERHRHDDRTASDK